MKAYCIHSCYRYVTIIYGLCIHRWLFGRVNAILIIMVNIWPTCRWLWDDQNPVDKNWKAGNSVIIFKENVAIHNKMRKVYYRPSILQTFYWRVFLYTPVWWPGAFAVQHKTVLLWLTISILTPDAGREKSTDYLPKVSVLCMKWNVFTMLWLP